MAAKLFTGLPLDGPDPECVHDRARDELELVRAGAGVPRPAGDHSKPVAFVRKTVAAAR
jgi:hypothetical protein